MERKVIFILCSISQEKWFGICSVPGMVLVTARQQGRVGCGHGPALTDVIILVGEEGNAMQAGSEEKVRDCTTKGLN